MLRQHWCNDLVPQVAAPRSTHTHTVNDDDLRISDLAEIAKVDRYGSDPKFPQHDGVQRWRDLCSYAALRGPHIREKGEEAHGREGN
jgi:hypothetical protein